jgi:preprotein translocase subunit YajC
MRSGAGVDWTGAVDCIGGAKPMKCCLAILSPLFAQNEGGGGFFGGAIDPILLMLVIFTLFYLLLIRPERRKRQETDRMLDSLKKNDRVLTIGGIYGVVVNVAKGAEDVTIRVDDGNNTRLRILRSAISRVIGTEEGEEKKESA